MRKTLGGDRLGSGSKMKVELHNYERSTHDMGYLWRSSAAPGTLIPFLCEVGLPGDTFDIDLNADVKTHPTLGPLFGSFKLQLDVFQSPIRLYNALLHNNELGIGMDMSKVLLPQMVGNPQPMPTGNTVPDIDNSQINPSCLLNYLGIRGWGLIDENATTQIRNFNAVPILAYWEIYKNYYANKQEEIGAYINTPLGSLQTTITTIEIDPGSVSIPQNVSGGNIPFDTSNTIIITYAGAVPDPNSVIVSTSGGGLGEVALSDLITGGWTHDPVGFTFTSNSGSNQGLISILFWRYKTNNDITNTTPVVETFPLSNIDDMRKAILQQSGATVFEITDSSAEPYGPILAVNGDGVANALSSQEGLALKTYQSDLFNNWLKTEWIDGSTGINAITAIDTSGGSFTLDTLNLSKKVYDMLNRIAVSGGSYDDWLDAVYVHERYTRTESPMYMGGLSKEVVFQEVVSNSGNQSGTEPLGSLAGKGVMTNKHKGGKIVVKVDEPSYIMGIVSLTPRIDYSQGNKWDTRLLTLNDLHKPALDEIGFQELITEQMAWWDTQWDDGNTEWVTFSAGKQPAWINYMTNVNQTKGNFAIANNEMFMTLNRRYQADETAIAPTPVSIVQDLTTYIDPSLYNFIFAETALDSQNFWVQIAIDMIARRKMSAKVMPNL